MHSSPKDVMLAWKSLYDDQLQLGVRLLMKRMREHAVEELAASRGLPRDTPSLDGEIHRFSLEHILQLCESIPGLCVTPSLA